MNRGLGQLCISKSATRFRNTFNLERPRPGPTDHLSPCLAVCPFLLSHVRDVRKQISSLPPSSILHCNSIRAPPSIRLQHYITAVRPLLRAVPRAGDPQRPAAADMSRMRGMPLLRRRLQAGGAARSQARVPLPQAKGEWSGQPLHHCLLLNPQGYQGQAGLSS